MPRPKAELLKRQEELERKAAESDRREREMQNLSQHGRKNNWPPLPDNFPVGPGFYQDFSADIPVEFQKNSKDYVLLMDVPCCNTVSKYLRMLGLVLC